MSAGIRLIIGLGNPGPQYAPSRHNVGAWFANQLATMNHTELKFQSKLFGSLAKLNGYDQPVLLFVPDTYMNESGKAVLAIAHYYKIPPQAILIAHDELDFDPGTIRLKFAGGHGGHNGLRNIVTRLGSSDFYRLRIGIGHPGHKSQVTNYVLHKPSATDEQLIETNLNAAIGVVTPLINGEFERAICQLHSD